MNSKVYQLIYRSKAQPDITIEQIKEIIDKAISFNNEAGISGCLVHDRGYFLQLLEGEKESVDQLYKKIKKDVRHTKAEILSTGHTKNRLFGSWEMGFVEQFPKASGIKKDFAVKAKKELGNVTTKNDFTSKVFWYNVHSLLTESLFYK